LFNDAIVQSSKSEVLEERIEILKEKITETLYINICRGLFERHKLLYSFLICTSIQRKAGHINELAWSFLLRGAGIFNKSEQPQKKVSFLSEAQWDLAYCV
jgi:dynein heavy chain, axonemal